jgi:hypothetical protein
LLFSTRQRPRLRGDAFPVSSSPAGAVHRSATWNDCGSL